MESESKTKTPAKTATPRTKAAGTATRTAKPKGTAASAKKAAAVASAEKAAPAPTLVTTTAPNNAAPEMKKKDLIDAVTERSGVKKNAVKPVVEALLAVLGDELAKGREMNLPPLGKVKITRIKQMASGRIVMCKLRQSDAAAEGDNDPKDPLADAAE